MGILIGVAFFTRRYVRRYAVERFQGSSGPSTPEDIAADLEASATAETVAREAKVQAIIKPDPGEIFQIEFPRSFVEWAVNKEPTKTAQEIRSDLLDNYTARLQEFRTPLPEVTSRDALWSSNPKTKTCEEVTRVRGEYLAVLDRLRGTPPRRTCEDVFTQAPPANPETVQDLSGSLYRAICYKDRNRDYQAGSIDKNGKVLIEGVQGKCIRSQSVNCRALAELDQTLVTTIPFYDAVNTAIFEQESELTENVLVLNQILELIDCNKLIGRNNILEPSETQLTKKLGYIDVPLLRLKLNELSPYYLSPGVVRYVSEFLIEQQEVDTEIKTLNTLSENITSISNRIRNYAEPAPASGSSSSLV